MAALTPRTQLKKAKAEIVLLKHQITGLEKEKTDLATKLKSAEDNREYYRKQHTELQAEMEQQHMVLDTLPGAPGRSQEVKNRYGACEERELTLFARWLGFLARGR